MWIVKVCLLFMFIVCEGKHVSRQNLKKESIRKLTSRGEVFDNLFNVYDPAYLAIVWPKITNGVHILIDHKCWDDMSVMLRDLADGRAWAYKAQDASGRYGAALFSGDRFWLGSKEQCWRLDQDTIENNGSRQGDVFTATRKQNDQDDELDWRWTGHEDLPLKPVVERSAPYRLAYTSVQIGLNITKINLVKAYDVTLGVCLPRSCSPRDVTSIINFSIMINDNLKANKTTSRNAKVTNVRQVATSYNAFEDNGAILLIFTSIFLIILSITATVIDLDLIKCLPYAKKSMTFDLEKYNTEPKTNKMAPKEIRRENEFDRMGLDNVSYMGVDFKCPPTIQLDMNCGERHTSCARCGKYRKQCSNPRSVRSVRSEEKLPKTEVRGTHLNQYNSMASLDTESRKRSLFCRLLLCFSLAYCWRRVFNKNTANKDLAAIHGMKIVATLWVMFVHVAVLVDYISDNSGDVNDQNNIYYILVTGTISFDTLFFVSGLFSSHHFFFLKSQYSVKELVGFRGACGQILQLVCFVSNRVIRLLPSYAYAVLLTAVLSRSSQSTSARTLPGGDDVNCNSYWWRNLLYLTNLYPTAEGCMQVSWYLSTETWLHAAGVLVLCGAGANIRARVVSALALIAALAATVTDASAAYFDFAHPFTTPFDAYTIIIARPWARMTPYFVGVLAGWLIHVLHGKLKVSKITSSLLWMASFSFIFASSAIPLVGLPWLGAWLHLSWPIALVWPVLMVTTGSTNVLRRVLTSSSIAALSRLCYGMLLLHVAIARSVLLATDTALCSHNLCIWLYFTGITVFTVLAALLISLFVEMPSCNLLRRLSECSS